MSSVKERWLESASTIGTLYRDVYWLLKKKRGPKSVAALSKMMYEKGLKSSGDFVKKLKLKRSLEGAAKALLALEETYGIESRITEKSPRRIVIRCTSCLWAGKKGWTPEVCASIEAYERGLVKGIAGAKHHAAKRRSGGDEYCEIIISK
jgi:predicted ArsR family transcriptional regulator